MSIEERIRIYGPSICPACGNVRETVFASSRAGLLTCRDHPGHPLYGYGKHEAGRPREDRHHRGLPALEAV